MFILNIACLDPFFPLKLYIWSRVTGNLHNWDIIWLYICWPRPIFSSSPWMIHIALKDDKSEILVSWSGAIYDALRNYAFLFYVKYFSGWPEPIFSDCVVGQDQSFPILLEWFRNLCLLRCCRITLHARAVTRQYWSLEVPSIMPYTFFVTCNILVI